MFEMLAIQYYYVIYHGLTFLFINTYTLILSDFLVIFITT